MAASPLYLPYHESTGALVFHVDLEPDAFREAQALKQLDATEHARLQRFRHPRRRREFVLCRAALRALLCQRLGCRNFELAFAASRHGKPYAVVDGIPNPVSFNVSHSEKHGLIALAAAGRIGVDVEERSRRHDPDGELRTVFAPAEQAELARATGPRKLHLFVTLWTMKEALVKGVGEGLARDTSTFEIPSPMYRGVRSTVFRFPDAPSVGWRLENIGNSRFAAALACEVRADRPPWLGRRPDPSAPGPAEFSQVLSSGMDAVGLSSTLRQCR